MTRFGDWFLASMALLVGGAHCGSNSPTGGDGGSCSSDQNGTSGGTQVVYLTVSDMAFAVGGVDSGSTQSNITIENAATVTLTLTNTGTRPHDFVVDCMPTPNTNGCPMESCFPLQANIPALAPGTSATTTFVAPFPEGVYEFHSDVPGDTETSDGGGVTGLIGEFVLM